MKKKILSLLCVVSLTFFANAQGDGLSWGVKGGVNYSNVTESGFSYDASIGFYVGGYARYSLSDRIVLQPELLLSQQGYGKSADKRERKYILDSSNDGMFVENELDAWQPMYINLPIMGKYFFTEGFCVELGPQLGFIVSDDDAEDMGKFDLGLALGLGYELENGLNFNVRWTEGFMDLADGVDAKNRVFSVGVGYTF